MLAVHRWAVSLCVYIYVYKHNISVSVSLAKSSFGSKFQKHQQSVVCLYLFLWWFHEIKRLGLPLLSCLKENLVGDFSKPPAPLPTNCCLLFLPFLAMKLEFSISLEGGMRVCILRLLWWAWSVGFTPSQCWQPTGELSPYVYIYICTQYFCFCLSGKKQLWGQASKTQPPTKCCLYLFILPVVAWNLKGLFQAPNKLLSVASSILGLKERGFSTSLGGMCDCILRLLWLVGTALGLHSFSMLPTGELSPYVYIYTHNTSVSVSLKQFVGASFKNRTTNKVLYLFILPVVAWNERYFSVALRSTFLGDFAKPPTNCCLLPLPFLARKLGFSTSLGHSLFLILSLSHTKRELWWFLIQSQPNSCLLLSLLVIAWNLKRLELPREGFYVCPPLHSFSLFLFLFLFLLSLSLSLSLSPSQIAWDRVACPYTLSWCSP